MLKLLIGGSGRKTYAINLRSGDLAIKVTLA
jgi:hypothetical protein